MHAQAPLQIVDTPLTVLITNLQLNEIMINLDLRKIIFRSA